jgi:deoxyribodipyrimidine photolyase
MRQLLRERFMHNRDRMVGDFFTKHLSIHRHEDVARFAQHLVDGVFANNTGDWQWHVPDFGAPDNRLPLA